MGENARRAAESRYDRRIATRNWADAVASRLGIAASGSRESARDF
jgi:hypothetical protein